MGMSAGGGRPGAVQSEINVTPLIDVLLVLLIIFMVVMPIMMKEEAILVPRKLDEAHEVPDPNARILLIKVKVDLSIDFSDGNSDLHIQPADLLGTLGPKLEGLKSGTDKVVFVDFEDGVPWLQVVQTMDTIRHLANDPNHDEIKVALKIKDPTVPGAP